MGLLRIRVALGIVVGSFILRVPKISIVADLCLCWGPLLMGTFSWPV